MCRDPHAEIRQDPSATSALELLIVLATYLWHGGQNACARALVADAITSVPDANPLANCLTLNLAFFLREEGRPDAALQVLPPEANLPINLRRTFVDVRSEI